MVGSWGALATDPFASDCRQRKWRFFGNPRQLLTQALAVAASISFAFIRQFVAFESNPRNGWVRVDHEAERMVLDPANTTKNDYALEA
jgi:ammonia channel protein AmtB